MASASTPTSSSIESLNGLGPVHSSFIYQQVASKLARFISQELKPGDALPSERDLAQQLSASRQSIREALRTLEFGGLVQTRRGTPSVVGTPHLWYLTEWLSASVPRTSENTHNLMDVRAVLEIHAASLAAKNITEEQLGRLRENLERTRIKASAGENPLGEDDEFHSILFEACGNTLLQLLEEVLAGLLRAVREEILAKIDRGKRMVKLHGAILTALEARDSDAAAEAMRKHMVSVQKLIDGLFDSKESSEGNRRKSSP
jgi:GntR family transcriptional regulator, transcriptional repressor for pyruvate dehydrogenase complex